jgi:class 3 adenylate cyclase/predicted ATPase
MEVGDWLRGLGLGQYEDLFRANEIDGDVLPDLTEGDFEKLGVPMGHRKRLLKAAATFRTAETAAPERSSASTAAEAAERRQLTVMFCDLVGSTALSARLDPEDMRAVIAAYHKSCAALIEGGGGFVAKYMGDGVLAYFGYPQAHEHDAEHAVRAALLIVEAAPRLETPAGAALHVRVGIATGIVVVGDLLGSGQAQERGVVGDTPNLAARLQSIAAPDGVVIAEGTRRLIGDLFELRDLGPQELKGVASPTRAYAALRESARESRFDALHADGLTALVGRGEETELLRRRWTRAKAGEGQVVLLSGEAGIGKSRLAAEFLQGLADEPHHRMRYFCSPQHADSALHPIIAQLERAAGFSRNDDPTTRLDRLDARLAASSTSREDAALLAELLSLPNDGRYPALELSPQQRRQRTLHALIAQTEALARQMPALMVFEDAHWADASSLETLSHLVDRIPSMRTLLFVTFRPEFAAPWVGRPHVTTLSINRLTQREAEALIDKVAGSEPLPAGVRQDIVERADGVPLFVEEMTKAVLEAGSEGAARAVAGLPSAALGVPASLHASLMARLDRLGEAKAVAQTGAAIGREFSYALLAAVTSESDTRLGGLLDRLVQAGLFYRRGSANHATYFFKHALVQDTAYGTLLREPRRALHGRIAGVLENRFPEVAENQPEILARHFADAGAMEKAASLWGKAGQRSLERSAPVEAEAQFKRALEAIAALPGAPRQRREQINLQVGLAKALMHSKGYASPESKAAFEQTRIFVGEADALGESLDDPLVLFSVIFGFWMANFVAFNADAVRDLAAECLSQAEKHGKAVPLVLGHFLNGMGLVVSGDFSGGLAHLDRLRALYDPAEHSQALLQFGADVGIWGLLPRAYALWALGRPEGARADIEDALALARRIGHLPTLMGVLHLIGSTQLRLGNIAAAKAQADELVALAEEKGVPAFIAHGMADQSCALAASGETAEAVQLFERAIAYDRSLASTVEIPSLLSVLAECHAKLEQFVDARRCIAEAIAAAEESGERWWEADFHRVAGEVELMAPERDTAKAEASFERALEVARAHEARSFELRAATSMARLRRDQGRRAEARALLAPVYGRFTEGFDTPDLLAARSLLEELA